MNLTNIINNVSIVQIVDVLIVWWLLYRLFLLMRGTKAVTLLRGVAIVVIVKIISWYFGLATISWLTDQIINWGVIALVVIFQPEIRRGLEHLGRSNFLRQHQANKQAENLVTSLGDAIEYMSKRHIGALITIQMEMGLSEYIETGIPVDADITSQLIIQTFIPNTPLHDGAMIISDFRIAVASAYLPLSDSPLIPKELGTRHRASVGISEVTDALTIVVSEESGEVSITRNSELMQSLSRESYMKYLERNLIVDPDEQPRTVPERIKHAVKGMKGAFSKGGK